MPARTCEPGCRKKKRIASFLKMIFNGLGGRSGFHAEESIQNISQSDKSPDCSIRAFITSLITRMLPRRSPLASGAHASAHPRALASAAGAGDHSAHLADELALEEKIARLLFHGQDVL